MDIDSNTKPTYGDDDKYIKTKITTNFYNKKVPEEKISHKCLSTIILDSVFYAGAPITVANDAIEMLPDNIDKTFNDLSK